MKNEKTFKGTIKEINKKFGENTVVKVGDSKVGVAVESISTGSYSLDYIMGCGGLPRGRIVEIYGQQSSGKTTLALFLVAGMQKRGMKALWIDAEYAFDVKYAKGLGVDTDALYLVQPGTGEEALEILHQLIETNEFDIAVVDSVAALVPQAEVDGGIAKDTVALQARMMSRGLRVLTPVAARSKTAMIFINQLREKVGVFYGNRWTTPGGNALKFYTSIRVKAWRKNDENIKDHNGDNIGGVLHMVAEKNKVGVPFREGAITLYFGSGIDLTADLIGYAEKKGIIERKGNTYFFGDKKIGVGRRAAMEKIASSKELRNDIESVIKLHKDLKK